MTYLFCACECVRVCVCERLCACVCARGVRMCVCANLLFSIFLELRLLSDID